ncbi:hypothetical protein PFISCL1PPCAC_21460 [Pristionchus fissidentatus]|uniref:Uncharacterized protein n=1 Tax=Pristionchus fissidentatus TaxID=1538716 RepID=A0AAV5WIM5_9BILA|nr:hypothetical protein PFISCL1PPCAC_21460 [Pristionchus fissidentatus]
MIDFSSRKYSFVTVTTAIKSSIPPIFLLLFSLASLIQSLFFRSERYYCCPFFLYPIFDYELVFLSMSRRQFNCLLRLIIVNCRALHALNIGRNEIAFRPEHPLRILQKKTEKLYQRIVCPDTWGNTKGYTCSTTETTRVFFPRKFRRRIFHQ